MFWPGSHTVVLRSERKIFVSSLVCLKINSESEAMMSGQIVSFQDNRSEEGVDGNIHPRNIHYLPFKIGFDGPASVSARFDSTIEKCKNDDDEEVLINSFRTRPLQGKEIKIPANYLGLVTTSVDLKRGDRDNRDENLEKNITLVSKFDGFTYWNWDQPPSGMDPPRKLMDMLDISELIHSPEEEEEGETNSSICDADDEETSED